MKSKKKLYLDRMFGFQDPLLEALAQEAKKESVEKMQISPHEGRILYFLTKISGAKKAVEIGTLYGFSTLHIARALPAGGVVFTLDANSARHKKAQKILRASPDFSKIKWISGPAKASLQTLESQAPFDMIFIDADKAAYENYLLWAEKHLKPGGLLIADNSFLFGAVYEEATRATDPQALQSMKNFNERIARSPNWEGALIPTDEGLSIGIKQKV